MFCTNGDTVIYVVESIVSNCGIAFCVVHQVNNTSRLVHGMGGESEGNLKPGESKQIFCTHKQEKKGTKRCGTGYS
jgi:hypothetical protein